MGWRIERSVQSDDGEGTRSAMVGPWWELFAGVVGCCRPLGLASTFFCLGVFLASFFLSISVRSRPTMHLLYLDL